MGLVKIHLQNFRNHGKASFEFEKRNLLLGPNGSGKSNILEAIYLLAVGRSFRADTEGEMITYGEKLSVVSCQLAVNEESKDLRITLTDGSMEYARKKFEINGISRLWRDFAGTMRAVLFAPSDLELVTGSPSLRRKYLDFVLGQADREYRRSLVSYEKGLRQRNKLLDQIREGVARRPQLFFWDRLLIKDGNYITRKREDYLNYLGETSEKRRHRVIYDKSLISEERIKRYEKEEVAAAATLVGPHRDDFMVELDGKDVSKFGSRGEQRMAVLWLKMGEMAYLEQETLRQAQGKAGEYKEKPILLLDDVFSELDHKHRDKVMELMDEQTERGGQVVMTTADEHLVPESKEWKLIRLRS